MSILKFEDFHEIILSVRAEISLNSIMEFRLQLLNEQTHKVDVDFYWHEVISKSHFLE